MTISLFNNSAKNQFAFIVNSFMDFQTMESVNELAFTPGI